MIHTKFVDNVLDFPKIQKGGAAPSGHPGILGPTSKKWKILVFPLYRYENERGQKGGGTKKGGAAFPNVGSDQLYHNMRL